MTPEQQEGALDGCFKKRNGRGGEIRTPDLLLPKQARYQAALRPDTCAKQHASLKEFRPIGKRNVLMFWDRMTASEVQAVIVFKWVYFSSHSSRLRCSTRSNTLTLLSSLMSQSRSSWLSQPAAHGRNGGTAKSLLAAKGQTRITPVS